jgi:hypothetical protein
MALALLLAVSALPSLTLRDSGGAVVAGARSLRVKVGLGTRPAVEVVLREPFVRRSAQPVQLAQALAGLLPRLPPARARIRIENGRIELARALLRVDGQARFDAAGRASLLLRGEIQGPDGPARPWLARGSLLWDRARGRIRLAGVRARVGQSWLELGGGLGRDRAGFDLRAQIEPAEARLLLPQATPLATPVRVTASARGPRRDVTVSAFAQAQRGSVRVLGHADLDGGRAHLRCQLDDVGTAILPGAASARANGIVDLVANRGALELTGQLGYVREVTDPNLTAPPERLPGGQVRLHVAARLARRRLRGEYQARIADPGMGARVLWGRRLVARPRAHLELHGRFEAPGWLELRTRQWP